MEQLFKFVGWCLFIGALPLGVLAQQADRAVQAPGPLAPLSGSLRGPGSATSPVVLIIPGSGPTDRDGNGLRGVTASTYRLLAEGLADKGITTVRVDKRGMFGSEAAVADANAVTVDDYVADVQSWVKTLRRSTGAPCVWVAGHSEGGLVALVAGRRDADVCGLILIATPGRPLGQVLREQLKANPANASVIDQALRAIDTLEAGRRVDTTDMHRALMPLFANKVQGWLRSAFAVDPARVIQDVEKPVLIVQGDRDLQVSVADAQRLQQAQPAAKLVVLHHANHLLKVVDSEERSANFATYGNPDLPLAPGTVEAVADFVSAGAKRR